MTMVTVSNRARRNRAIPRRELRERIAKAAIELFHARGYEAVAVDQIVQRGGFERYFLQFFSDEERRAHRLFPRN